MNNDVEFKRFLEIALRSLFEVETQIILAIELNYIKKAKFSDLNLKVEECQKMINGFIEKLKSD